MDGLILFDKSDVMGIVVVSDEMSKRNVVVVLVGIGDPKNLVYEGVLGGLNFDLIVDPTHDVVLCAGLSATLGDYGEFLGGVMRVMGGALRVVGGVVRMMGGVLRVVGGVVGVMDRVFGVVGVIGDWMIVVGGLKIVGGDGLVIVGCVVAKIIILYGRGIIIEVGCVSCLCSGRTFTTQYYNLFPDVCFSVFHFLFFPSHHEFFVIMVEIMITKVDISVVDEVARSG